MRRLLGRVLLMLPLLVACGGPHSPEDPPSSEEQATGEDTRDAIARACDFTTVTTIEAPDKTSLERRSLDTSSIRSTEGSVFDGYYDADDLRMIAGTIFGETGRVEVEVRMLEDGVYRMTIADVRYEAPIGFGEGPVVEASVTHDTVDVCGGIPIRGDSTRWAGFVERLTAGGNGE